MLHPEWPTATIPLFLVLITLHHTSIIENWFENKMAAALHWKCATWRVAGERQLNS